MSRKKKKPSFPAPSKEVPQVNSTPPGCPRCGCSDRTNKEGIKRREMNGTTRDGFHYTEVAWSYVSCCECKMKYRIIEYLRPKARGRES